MQPLSDPYQAINQKNPQEYHPKENNNGRQVDPAKIHGDQRPDPGQYRFRYIVDKSNDRVVWIRIHPGQHGPRHDNPHEQNKNKVHHLGQSQQ